MASALPSEVEGLIGYCQDRNLYYIIGCDVYAHHTIWAVAILCECLLEFLTTDNVHVVNKVYDPTFLNAVRQEVLNLMLSSPFLDNKIKNWHVSKEVSMSDHQHIEFEIEVRCMIEETTRVPRLTNWELYKEAPGRK